MVFSLSLSPYSLKWTIKSWLPASASTPDSSRALYKWSSSKQIAVAVLVMLFFFIPFANGGGIWIFFNCTPLAAKNSLIYLHLQFIGIFLTFIFSPWFFKKFIWFYSWMVNFEGVPLLLLSVFKLRRRLLFMILSLSLFLFCLVDFVGEFPFWPLLIERVCESLWFKKGSFFCLFSFSKIFVPSYLVS